MNEKPSVLVTGVGACGVGEGVAKAVRMTDGYETVFVNADANAPELFEADHRYIVPKATEAGYLDSIRAICTKHGVVAILPGSEPEAKVLSANKERFSALGVSVLTNPPRVVEIGQDKWKTYEFLTSAGIATPNTIRPAIDRSRLADLGFPLILKPRSGHASQNVYVVVDEEDLEAHLAVFDRLDVEPIAQQFIPGGEEYTCSALVGDGGTILGSIAMRRDLLGGFSQRVEVQPFPEAVAVTEATALALGAWGPINVQCRYWNGLYWIFEINARFSGSAPFRALAGFNEPDILLQYVLTGRAPQFSIEQGMVGMRRLEEVLVPANVYANVAGPAAFL